MKLPNSTFGVNPHCSYLGTGDLFVEDQHQQEALGNVKAVEVIVDPFVDVECCGIFFAKLTRHLSGCCKAGG